MYAGINMDYFDIASAIMQSNAILDVNASGQTGMTLRPMERRFFGKKLITSNVNIKEFDFFNDANVFVLNKRSLDELSRFLASEYKPVKMEILKRYTMEYWLEQFLYNKYRREKFSGENIQKT